MDSEGKLVMYWCWKDSRSRHLVKHRPCLREFTVDGYRRQRRTENVVVTYPLSYTEVEVYSNKYRYALSVLDTVNYLVHTHCYFLFISLHLIDSLTYKVSTTVNSQCSYK